MDGAHRTQRVNVSAATGFGHPPKQPQGASMTGPLALPDLAAHADAAAIIWRVVTGADQVAENPPPVVASCPSDQTFTSARLLKPGRDCLAISDRCPVTGRNARPSLPSGPSLTGGDRLDGAANPAPAQGIPSHPPDLRWAAKRGRR